MTRQITTELNQFLFHHNYYNYDDYDFVNKSVITLWDDKLQNSIIYDLKQKIKGVEIKKTRSLFDIFSDEQGATLYKIFFEIINNNEKIEVIVKIIVNYNKAMIYLSSIHADMDNYLGQSRLLGQLYKELKKAENKIGYFLPLDFYKFEI